jgi:uncharacterized protein
VTDQNDEESRAAVALASNAGSDTVHVPPQFNRVVADARLAAGLTQTELATRLGTTQSAVARLESGGVTPTVATLRRLADVLHLQFEIAPGAGLAAHRIERRGLTLDDLRAQREEILRVAADHGARNVRVFGSVARGEAREGSDVDFLVDLETDRRGFAYFGLLEDLRRSLEHLLGVPVDVTESVQAHARESVARDALPL